LERVTPSYDGANLVNLVAELECRLAGSSPSPGLRAELAALIPPARHYLLVIFDGLGADQLSHPRVSSMVVSHRGDLEAPYPTTTTVGLSSIVTGLTPRQHGVIGYRQWLPEVGKVVNLLRWTDLSGQAVDYDTGSFLPAPNLWERLAARRVSGVIVQPAGFFRTPLSRMLYRGAQMRGYSSPGEVDPAYLVNPSTRTLAMVYHHQVDVAAHENGRLSPEFGEAIAGAEQLWARLAARLPADTVMVGTSDHGHCDIGEADKLKLSRGETKGMRWWGDSRSLMLKGPPDRIGALAERTGSEVIPQHILRRWLGGGRPHRNLQSRLPDAVLLASDHTGIFPKGMDTKKIGHHGGLTRAEVEIPLLVAD